MFEQHCREIKNKECNIMRGKYKLIGRVGMYSRGCISGALFFTTTKN